MAQQTGSCAATIVKHGAFGRPSNRASCTRCLSRLSYHMAERDAMHSAPNRSPLASKTIYHERLYGVGGAAFALTLTLKEGQTTAIGQSKGVLPELGRLCFVVPLLRRRWTDGVSGRSLLQRLKKGSRIEVPFWLDMLAEQSNVFKKSGLLPQLPRA